MRKILTAALAFLALSLSLKAQYRDDQFKRDAFTQTYADTTLESKTDTSKLFSFKEYFGGLAHKRTASLRTLTMGSAILVGGTQIYNRDYWKLPIIYGGIGAGVGLGIYYGNQFRNTGEARFQTLSYISYAGAALTYWGSFLDGAVCYKDPTRVPSPAKSTMYSLLLPGLGQIYNGEAWKVPLYLGLIAGGAHFWADNNRQYLRWKNTYDLANSTDPNVVKPPQSAETAKYYRDVYRRYRDYSILATALFYLVQVIDANVIAYMVGFEVTDDISLRVEPALQPTLYAQSPAAMGVSIGLRF